MPSPKQQVVTINISSISLAKILIILGTIGFIYLVKDIVALVFVSLIFASALAPWVATLEQRRIPRPLAIWMIYMTVIAIIILSIVLLIPPLTEQFNQLVISFPQYSDTILSYIRNIQGDGATVNLIDQIKNALKSLEAVMVQAAGGIFSKLLDVISGLVGVVVVMVMTFYMTIEDGILKRAMSTVVPARYHAYAHSLISRIQGKIGLWLRAQMILCFIIFLASWVGLWILGLKKYALILALIAGLTELIPMVGPIIGAVPAVFIAFGQSPWMALWVILLYLLIQRIENDVLVPKVMQKAVGVNPLISIIAILIGAKIAGIVGVMLAIPVVTAIGVIISDFFGEEDESLVEVK